MRAATATNRLWTTILLTCVVLWTTATVQAHPWHDHDDDETSFAAGFAHPTTGFDHLLAMVAVGVLAVQVGGHALWLMPATFLGGMLLGGAMAACGIPLPGVEYGILASVLALGTLIALDRPLPLGWVAAGVGVFALFHGHAHAAGMAGHGSFASYAAGMLLATALLHAAGIAGGWAIVRAFDRPTVRWAGGAVAGAGLLLCAGVL